MELDVVNPDDANVVLDEVIVADDVYVVVVANLDDEVVEVDEVDFLGYVAVVVNLIDVTVDDMMMPDDLDVVVVAIDVMSELLTINDDVDDVGVDHLNVVVCWLLPVDVADVLLVVDVVVNDVKVVVFQVVNDDDCDAAVVGNVADDVKRLILQDVGDSNSNDATCCKNALMHAKEKASKDDERTLVRWIVMNKNVYEDVDVNDEVVVEDDVVEDVEYEQVEVCDVDVNEEIQLLDLDVLQVSDVLKVVHVDGKVPLKTCDANLAVTWGWTPPLGKVPMNVQDANVDVSLRDFLLDVVMHSKVPILDVVFLPDDVEVVLTNFVQYFWSVMLTRSMDRMMLMYWVSPQFLMCKVMSKSACVIFSRMLFSWMLSSLVKLSCMLSITMSMFMFMLNSLALLWFMVLMRMLSSLMM